MCRKASYQHMSSEHYIYSACIPSGRIAAYVVTSLCSQVEQWGRGAALPDCPIITTQVPLHTYIYYIYVYLYMYIHMCIYICVCIYICIYVCMHACMYVCSYVCVNVCMFIHIYIHTYVYIYILIYIYIYIYPDIYMCIMQRCLSAPSSPDIYTYAYV
jgi:hypothetical protein